MAGKTIATGELQLRNHRYITKFTKGNNLSLPRSTSKRNKTRTSFYSVATNSGNLAESIHDNLSHLGWGRVILAPSIINPPPLAASQRPPTHGNFRFLGPPRYLSFSGARQTKTQSQRLGDSQQRRTICHRELLTLLTRPAGRL